MPHLQFLDALEELGSVKEKRRLHLGRRPEKPVNAFNQGTMLDFKGLFYPGPD